MGKHGQRWYQQDNSNLLDSPVAELAPASNSIQLDKNCKTLAHKDSGSILLHMVVDGKTQLHSSSPWYNSL